MVAPPVDTHPLERLSRDRLTNLLALGLMAVVFTLGAWSWAQFFMSPKGGAGSHTGLFSQADYPAVSLASRLITSGQGAHLYDLDLQLEGQRQLIREGYINQTLTADLLYPYPYAPFVAVLNAPLAGLSPLTAMAVWDLINIACMALGLWVLLSSLPLARTARYWLLLGGLTCFPFIVNLEQGQSSGVIMLGLAAGIALLRRGNDLSAGATLGLLLLKIQWLPFLVLVLLFKGRWRALLGMALTGAALLLLSVLTMGTGWIPGFLDMLQRAQRFDPALALTPWASHSLTGQLAALIFGSGANVNAAGNETIRNITLAVTLLSAALVVWVWRGPWRPGKPAWDGAMSLTVLATAFTNLQLNTHDLCLLVVPAALGAAYFRESVKQESPGRVWYALVLALYLLTSLAFPLLFAAPIRLMPIVIGLMILVLGMSLLRYRASIRM
ncbi:MAG: DUF2029 domain-containing protein [Chloroflexota bacterium]|nr:DUF2029 domain-containing protein [Chloroflexota bacterium]MDQ5865835.1 DUF2029 domain-containing protein [Chloroflexota bacterium]